VRITGKKKGIKWEKTSFLCWRIEITRKTLQKSYIQETSYT